jgi:hypothetical protein
MVSIVTDENYRSTRNPTNRVKFNHGEKTQSKKQPVCFGTCSRCVLTHTYHIPLVPDRLPSSGGGVGTVKALVL